MENFFFQKCKENDMAFLGVHISVFKIALYITLNTIVDTYIMNNNICLFLRNYYSADTLAAMLIAVMTIGTMFPMAVYTGKILLQVNLSAY